MSMRPEGLRSVAARAVRPVYSSFVEATGAHCFNLTRLSIKDHSIEQPEAAGLSAQPPRAHTAQKAGSKDCDDRCGDLIVGFAGSMSAVTMTPARPTIRLTAPRIPATPIPGEARSRFR